MRAVGRVLHKAGVSDIYLVHGTFAGTDASGFIGELARLFPKGGRFLRRAGKELVDALAGDVGNYTPEYARRFQTALNGTAADDTGDAEAECPEIGVHLFHWSGENHHLGRADGAVRLIDRLVASKPKPGSRILLWGHSHAGNVFAMLTNLLAGDVALREAFFAAAKSYFRSPIVGRVDLPVWERVERYFESAEVPAGVPLDVVTFGTPVRYGWDSGGYDRLLHFIHHRPPPEGPDYLCRFPIKGDDVLRAAGGDYVQQLGIAGTNFLPPVFAWRSFLAESRLKALLQAGYRDRDVLARLRLGMRVPSEGTTLLVDYGPVAGHVARHLAGHAVYTRIDWLLFHAEEVARRLYALPRTGA